MRRLIVNADDFGRTRGVNAGTLRSHGRGIVTSATTMVLEPAAAAGLREAVEQTPDLSLGLHFALTGGGAPASAPASLVTLAPSGKFVRRAEDLPDRLPAEEVRRELDAQIALFESLAGRPPSHLDSHHHCALHPSVQPVFAEVALERGLPVRAASTRARRELREAGLRVPDHFLESFYDTGATLENLRLLIEELSEGTSELMCHPGERDDPLLSASGYASERGREAEILCEPGLRAWIAESGIELVSFRQI